MARRRKRGGAAAGPKQPKAVAATSTAESPGLEVSNPDEPSPEFRDPPKPQVAVEYVAETIGPSALASMFENVFSRFSAMSDEVKQPRIKEETPADDSDEEDLRRDKPSSKAGGEDPENGDPDGDGAKKRLTRREKKLLTGTKLAEMKQQCKNPSVVEIWDANAPDPQLLIFLKSYRNTVPVPRHWSEKGRYLSRKLGKEKSSYQLPDYIAATGIGKMRDEAREKEESKSLKQKQSAKMRAKVSGKLNLDYQVMYEAFFKHQTKPRLTGFGEMYYAGKEEEDMSEKRKSFKPGTLSADLRAALGIGPGDFVPWIYNLQRFGPPPCYPGLQIQGARIDTQPIYVNENLSLDRSRWGDLEEQEEEDDEEENNEEEEHAGEEEPQEEAPEPPAAIEDGSGVSLPQEPADGGSSVIAATPTEIDLRKRRSETSSSGPPALYQVVTKQEAGVGTGLGLGTTHTYNVPKAGNKLVDLMKGKGNSKVEVTLNPDELEKGLDEKDIKEKYEEARKEKQPQVEDFSDMVAEREREKNRKRKEREKGGKGGKSSKQFKF